MSAARFHTLAAIVGLLWLGVVLPVRFVQSPVTYDFPQYYMGGVVALEGDWDALYPEPLVDSRYNAGYPAGSVRHPRYRARAEALGVPDGYRFTQAPAVALLWAPLALFDYRTAYFVWIGALCLACWVTALLAAEIARALRPGHARRFADGMLVLVVCASPLAYATVRYANVSGFVGLGVGLVLLGLLARSDSLVAVALAGSGLVKYATGILVPLLAVLGRWRALFGTAAIALAVSAIALALTGLEPWERWLTEILPSMGRTPYERSNQSLPGALATFWRDGPPAWLRTGLRVVGLVLLAAFCGYLWRRRAALRSSFAHVCAAAAVLLAWWTLVGPLFWTHYYVYFVPLWGWLLHEARPPGWRRLAAYGFIALSLFPQLVVLEPPFPLGLFMLAGVPALLAVAGARLAAPVPPTASAP